MNGVDNKFTSFYIMPSYLLTPKQRVSLRFDKGHVDDRDKFVKDTLRFIENNASIVGGCCEVSPKYIKALKNKIQTIK